LPEGVAVQPFVQPKKKKKKRKRKSVKLPKEIKKFEAYLI
jgi:hypothetical protein